MFRVLIAEGDTQLQNRLRGALAGAGFQTVTAADGAQALAAAEESAADILVLDAALANLDGFSLLARLRSAGCEAPVLLLTGQGALNERKRGFRLGADDCMEKPADEEELLLRVLALLRRVRAAGAHKLAVGETELCYDDLAVVRRGRVTHLPRKEFLLLFRLLSGMGKTFTRRQLLDEIWGLDSDSGEHTVNVHINRLRERFCADCDFSIVTVRGLGYKAVQTG